jgi:hypothetical protein
MEGEESVTLLATASSHVGQLWKQKFLKKEKEREREKHLMHYFA